MQYLYSFDNFSASLLFHVALFCIIPILRTKAQKEQKDDSQTPVEDLDISGKHSLLLLTSENIKKHKSSYICSWDGSMTFTVKNVGHLKQYSYHS